MDNPREKSSSRIEIIIAVLIAAVSITIAAAAWRISSVSSSAGDASRQGIIDSIKKQTGENEDWRKAYEEAGYSEKYAVYLAQVEALEASGDPAAISQATNLRQYLLPNLQLMASPLASEETYRKPDGTFDIQKRFDDLQASSPNLSSLNPEVSFQLSDRYSSEQRWLTAASVVLAISLFWLALAEIGGKKQRLLTLIIGAGVYGFGLLAMAIIEIIFAILRGGAL